MSENLILESKLFLKEQSIEMKACNNTSALIMLRYDEVWLLSVYWNLGVIAK